MRFDYEVIRAKRKTLTITVASDNKITVRCPLRMEQSRIDAFIREKSAWIERILAKNSAISEENAEILNYTSIYINGKKYPLAVGSTKNSISANGVCVKKLCNLKKLYCDAFLPELTQKVNSAEGLISVLPSEIAVKNFTSRWGCCSGSNKITFNWKIFMLSSALREYVIIHELCHIKHHDHSSAFWGLVGEYLPDYKLRRKALKNYDFLTRLY